MTRWLSAPGAVRRGIPDACAGRKRDRRRRAVLAHAPALVAAVALILPSQAGAIVEPALTLDGPSQDIAGFGGVAMAADGSGGIVYLKRVEGVPHVFVARYVNGAWEPPIRVDGEQPFAASSPRIGAANGGELEVVWATSVASEETHPVLELLGATLHPGASGFGPAKLVDRDIRYGTGVSPDLSMSPSGEADVVYRVVEPSTGKPSSIPLLRPGDVVEQVRVAHFEGEGWARLGSINRDSGVSMRAPTEANAPQVATGPTGNAVVVWQEPDNGGVARIWARRIFGRTLGYVMPASASSYGGAPIGDDADAPSVAITPTGEAEVAYRQAASPGSPLPGPRIFLDTLPDGFSGDGSRFLGAVLADSAVTGGDAAVVGPPAIDTDAKNDIRLLYDANGTPRVVQGNVDATSAVFTLGPSIASAEPAPASVMDPEGGGVSAWPSEDAEGPAVTVREDFPGGGAQTALIRGGIGGPVDALDVGRSGLGGGLLGFMQGPLGDAAIAAATVTAPPTQFLVTAPNEWVKPGGVVISWSAAESDSGPVRYDLVRDGRLQLVAPGATRARLSPSGLTSGTHSIQVLATDSQGETTLTPARSVRIDGRAPSVSVRRSRHGSLLVTVADPLSGVNAGSVKISFGDGASIVRQVRARHRYRQPGKYSVTVRAADRVGNVVQFHKVVSVG